MHSLKAPAVRATRHRTSRRFPRRYRHRQVRQLCPSKSMGESALLRLRARQIRSQNGHQVGNRSAHHHPLADRTSNRRSFSSRAKSLTASLLLKPRACQPEAWLPFTTKSATRAAYRELVSSRARRISRWDVPNWISPTARTSSAGPDPEAALWAEDSAGEVRGGDLFHDPADNLGAQLGHVAFQHLANHPFHDWFNPAAVLHSCSEASSCSGRTKWLPF